MQQTIHLGQAQPPVLFMVEGAAKSMREWLDGKSETFSALCGETFTHREVLLTAAACVGLVLILGVAGWLEGGAL